MVRFAQMVLSSHTQKWNLRTHKTFFKSSPMSEDDKTQTKKAPTRNPPNGRYNKSNMIQHTMVNLGLKQKVLCNVSN